MVKLTGKLQRLTIIVFVVSGYLAACNAPASPTVAPTQPAPVLPSSTTAPKPLPSLTFTPTPTATPSLTPTPTYLPITPALQGTAVPDSSGVISAANADRLTLLARWGLGNPNDLVYTPDGQYLIAACTTGVYFYDPADYSLVRQIDTLDRALHLAVSPDSQLLAVSGPAQVYIYQLSDLQLLNTFSGPSNSLDFSPDGQVLAVGRSSDPTATIQLRDVHSDDILGVITSDMGIWSVHFAPQGGFIASGGYSTKVWSLDGTLTTEQGPYAIEWDATSISFSTDGSLLAEGIDTRLHLWRLLENGRLTHMRQIGLSTLNYPYIREVAVSPDGSMVAAALVGGIFVWDVETGYRIFNAPANGNILDASLAWSADSRQLAAASPDFGVQVWDVAGEALLASLQSLSGSYTAVAWSPDGQMLAAGAEEGWANLISTQQGDLLQHLGSGYGLNNLAFTPDGQQLVLSGSFRNLEFWTLDGNLTRTLEGHGYGATEVRSSTQGELFSAIFSEDWQLEQVRVWNTADWSLASALTVGASLDYNINGFDLAPNLQTAAISMTDSTRSQHNSLVRIVAYPDGELVTILDPWGFIRSAAYSPSGELFALIYGSRWDIPSLQVWRTSDWTELYAVSVIFNQAQSGWVFSMQDSLAWSPDSTLLAVGTSDGDLQLFNAANGDLLITIRGHRMWAPALAFSPDGRWLASCSLDGTIMVWGVR